MCMKYCMCVLTYDAKIGNVMQIQCYQRQTSYTRRQEGRCPCVLQCKRKHKETANVGVAGVVAMSEPGVRRAQIFFRGLCACAQTVLFSYRLQSSHRLDSQYHDLLKGCVRKSRDEM